MSKKIISISMILLLAVSLVGCGESADKENTNTNKNTETKTNEVKTRPFTEASGIIKYFTIDGERVALPETVGEYVGYLEKIGKVELGDTEKTVSEAPEMEANEIASLTSYLKVYTTTSDYQWFGIHYFNSKDDENTVANASVDRITLTYDIYAEDPSYQQVKTIVLVTANGELPIDGKTTSKTIMKMLGAPEQNTDGYLKYTDDAGYVYKFATENQKGILTQVQISYPKN